jgi:uncharacterized flavoprotein (TIGR03862 family)
MSEPPFAIIGVGPAGLIAGDVLSAAGKRVVMFDRMPSVARKLLMAGRGGLNLTHSEAFEHFVSRYGAAQDCLTPILEAFPPSALITWVEELGQPTFVGSSGRVFPKAMKASPLLRALLARLTERGVVIRTRMRWTGWGETGALTFTHDDGSAHSVAASATLLALGGASWPKLGSDGAWPDILRARGVELTPFAPSNVGFNIAWSDHFRERFAGQPLKGVAVMHCSRRVRGEAMITRYGIEGGPIYQLSPQLRATAPTIIRIDLRPELRYKEVEAKLTNAKRRDTLASTLRKTLGLSPAAISLLYENANGPPPRDPVKLAATIKAVHLNVAGPRGIDHAISTAGGVAWSTVDENLQLRTLPGVYAAGEMLDWEAPTGGYLLQASFATGVHAARAMLGVS